MEPQDLRGAGPPELEMLGGLPSLRWLLRSPSAAPPEERLRRRDDLWAALVVDPVFLLRALRLCRSPILTTAKKKRSDTADAAPDEVLTANAIIDKLGTRALLSMLSAEAPEPGERGPLLELWLHSLAAAVAARSLAQLGAFDDEADPEVAFTCALLHDFPLLGQETNRCLGGTSPPWGPLEWSRAWNLPDQLQVAWLAAHSGDPKVCAYSGIARVTLAGEAIAILGGFAHPGEQCDAEGQLLCDIAGPQAEQVVMGLEGAMQKELGRTGLSLEMLRNPPERRAAPSPDAPALPAFEEGICKMLELGASELTRPVLTSLVVGICHYLDYDRAFYMQWIGKGSRALIRSKYDRTAVPVGSRIVVPSPIETELIGKVAGSGRPLVLDRQENFSCRLLDHLASDSVLVVPVVGGQNVHGQLFLDRAYTGRPAATGSDVAKALAFAGVTGQTLTALRLKRKDQKSRKEAQTDPLTGLVNRRAAINELGREILRMRRSGLPMTVLMLDLDRFKDWNDTYGHLMGDQILVKVAGVLKQTLRGSDIAARIGGEEFLVVQFDTAVEEASVVAARIFKEVENVGHDIGIPVTISIGLTDLRADDTVETLLARADRALYASKERGRNRFSVDWG